MKRSHRASTIPVAGEKPVKMPVAVEPKPPITHSVGSIMMAAYIPLMRNRTMAQIFTLHFIASSIVGLLIGIVLSLFFVR